jgi:TolA-binding protein
MMMTMQKRSRLANIRQWKTYLFFSLVGVLACGGCQTRALSLFSGRDDEKDRQLANIDGIRGPQERALRGRSLASGTSLGSAKGRKEFEVAERQFQKKEFRSAEKLATTVAEKYKGSPISEDALFLVAESQYAQQSYSYAADSYGKLIKEFPSTRHMQTCNRRRFTIAKYWLQDPQDLTSGDVKLASHQDESGKASLTVNPKKQAKNHWTEPSRAIPILPNAWDRTRPVFDTEGNALLLLKSIWQDDSTGPLADDALMLTASYYVRKRDFVEADSYYDILREQYPKSPHAKNAFVLGGFVKQASYQGPEYDSKQLDKAKILKESTLRLYPNNQGNDRIRDDLRNIQELKAKADWEYVIHYQKKGKPDSVAVYCREIIRLYPSSSYADRSRQLLLKMNAKADPRVRTPAPPKEKVDPKAPRRLFSIPKFAVPALPKFQFRKPKTIDSRSDSEKNPPGRVRI